MTTEVIEYLKNIRKTVIKNQKDLNNIPYLPFLKAIDTAIKLARNERKALAELVQYLEWREDFTVEDAEQGGENCYTKAKLILNKK